MFFIADKTDDGVSIIVATAEKEAEAAKEVAEYLKGNPDAVNSLFAIIGERRSITTAVAFGKVPVVASKVDKPARKPGAEKANGAAKAAKTVTVSGADRDRLVAALTQAPGPVSSAWIEENFGDLPARKIPAIAAADSRVEVIGKGRGTKYRVILPVAPGNGLPRVAEGAA